MKTGYIYKIWSVSNPEMVYYGSTQQQVCSRMNDHKRGYDTWKNPNKNKKFTSSYLIFDMGEYEYATLESIEFEELFELRNRERFYIENNTCVNCRVPNRTKKERYEENIEKNREKNNARGKKYREENKDNFNARRKKYREENREKVVASEKKYREENKEKLKDRRKIYDEATREKIAAYRKKHREENKEKIAAYRKKYQEENRENLNAKAKIYREKKRQEKLLKLT